MTKNEMLTEVSKFHKEWVKTIKGLGENTYAEDIVQEMYLKIHKYAVPERIIINGKLKKGYIFFVLKSILYDYRKCKTIRLNGDLVPVQKVSLDKFYNLSEEDDVYSEEFQVFCTKLDDEMEKWSWYDRELFKLYKSEYKRDLSLRKIAKETGISWVSIHNTIKKCSNKIKDNLSKDWDELNNK